jgi:hypothetical protein
MLSIDQSNVGVIKEGWQRRATGFLMLRSIEVNETARVKMSLLAAIDA